MTLSIPLPMVEVRCSSNPGFERSVGEARVERVWEVLTDVAHADQMLSGVEHVELITEGPYRVGTR